MARTSFVRPITSDYYVVIDQAREKKTPVKKITIELAINR